MVPVLLNILIVTWLGLSCVHDGMKRWGRLRSEKKEGQGSRESLDLVFVEPEGRKLKTFGLRTVFGIDTKINDSSLHSAL